MNPLILWSALQLALVSPAPISAAPIAPQDSEPVWTVQVYSVSEIHPSEAAQVLANLGLELEVVAVTGNGQIIVNAAPAVHEDVQDLLARLDVRSKEAESSTDATKVYVLRHVQARDGAKIVEQTLMSRRSKPAQMGSIVADSRTNSILATGPEAFQRMVQNVITQIDVAVAQGGAKERTLVYTPRYRNASDLLFVAQSQITSSGHLAVNEALNTIVIRDQSETVDKIEQLFAGLDLQAEPVKLEWWVLGHDPDGTTESIASSLPPVAKALEQMRLVNYAIISRAAVQTLENSPFKVRQEHAGTATPGQPTLTALGITGNVRLLDGGQTAMVTLDCHLEIATIEPDLDSGGRTAGPARRSGPGASSSNFSIDSTLKIRRNTHVVVGLSPAASSKDKPLVLVLRVE